MFIERDGKKYELTAKELSDANTEFVTNWMRKTLEEDFDVPEEFSQDYAEWHMIVTAKAMEKQSMNV